MHNFLSVLTLLPFCCTKIGNFPNDFKSLNKIRNFYMQLSRQRMWCMFCLLICYQNMHIMFKIPHLGLVKSLQLCSHVCKWKLKNLKELAFYFSVQPLPQQTEWDPGLCVQHVCEGDSSRGKLWCRPQLWNAVSWPLCVLAPPRNLSSSSLPLIMETIGSSQISADSAICTTQLNKEMCPILTHTAFATVYVICRETLFF